MEDKNFLKDKTAVFIGQSILLKNCIDLAKNKFKKIYVVTEDRNIAKFLNKKYKIIKNKNLKKYKFDFLFNILSKKIIDEKILKNIKYLSINFHDGPLPKYAGLYSSTWAIINGEKSHGCCWHKIVKKIDAGEIFERAKFKINDKITAYEIDLRSIFFGKICFRKMLVKFSKKNFKSIKQNLKLRSYYGKNDFLKIPSYGFFNFQLSFLKNLKVMNSLKFSDKKLNNISIFKILINKKPFLISKIKKIKINLKFKLGYLQILDKNNIAIKCKDSWVKVTFQNYSKEKLISGYQKIEKNKLLQLAKYGLKNKNQKILNFEINKKKQNFSYNDEKMIMKVFYIAQNSFKKLKNIKNISVIKTLGLGSHEEWDSLNHMKFLNNIEKKFNIKINERNLNNFNNIQNTAKFLLKIKKFN